MGKAKKLKKRRRGFLSSTFGQRFFNFAYSIGAAIVIWGALFKILHLPGGNFLLALGMGTEVLMFILSAFDRPPREYHWEKAFPDLDKDDYYPEESNADGESDEDDEFAGTEEIFDSQGDVLVDDEGNRVRVPKRYIVSEAQARQAVGLPVNLDLNEEDNRSLSESIAKMAAAADQLSDMAKLTTATQQYFDQMSAIAQEMEHLRNTTNALNQVSDVLLQSYRSITENSENITRSSQGYVEQIQDLNRNVAGLNTIYEIQLKSISSQLDSIDRVNRGIKDIRDMYEKSSSQSARYVEETEKMARYMQQLNSIYEKMITAMTVNMYRPQVIPGIDADQPQNS